VECGGIARRAREGIDLDYEDVKKRKQLLVLRVILRNVMAIRKGEKGMVYQKKKPNGGICGRVKAPDTSKGGGGTVGSPGPSGRGESSDPQNRRAEEEERPKKNGRGEA